MATNTQDETDAQRVEDGVSVDKSALGEVYEAAGREYDAREDLHAHPEGEKETLLNALEAVKFALDEGIVKTSVAVDRSHLATVHSAAQMELRSMAESPVGVGEQDSIETLREAIEQVGSVLYDSDDNTDEEGR